MALGKKPINGMNDVLPNEMKIRDYVIQVIKDTYRGFGFHPIETPCMENIKNLSSKQGGENEKLIFKVMKRGEKLKISEAETEHDLVDYGMRYDLTLPLTRFYSNNANQLTMPFKAVQIGNVWRADRPQKGRFRQFMQCDIDILGEASNIAEIELILATTKTLSKLGFKDFKIRINDRRILEAISKYSGFPEDQYDTVCIILDKLDKIGLNGVANELAKSGFVKECIDRYLKLLQELNESKDQISYLKNKLANYLDVAVISNLEEIIQCVNNIKTAEFELVYDSSLVRGMSYYTGTIFEIEMPRFHASCGGGGRYDKMIGSFTGKDVPACGFSIGFERIIMLLLENNFQIPGEPKKKVYLLDKGCDSIQACEVFRKAHQEREQGNVVLVTHMNKNKKFQKEQLKKEGYEEMEEFYPDNKQF